MDDKTHVATYLNEKDVQRLNKVGEETGLSVSAIIRVAIKRYLDAMDEAKP